MDGVTELRTPRLPMPPGGRSVGAYQPELSRALGAYQDAVVRLGALDPLTTEAVRLRCASHHDCHL